MLYGDAAFMNSLTCGCAYTPCKADLTTNEVDTGVSTIHDHRLELFVVLGGGGGGGGEGWEGVAQANRVPVIQAYVGAVPEREPG